MKQILEKIVCRLMDRKEILLSTSLIVLSAIVAVLYYISIGNFVFFNSDALYLPTLFKDILSKSGSIKDWYLTPAPYFFPDFFTFFFSYYLGDDSFSRIGVYSGMQVIVFSISILFLARQIKSLNNAPSLTAAIVTFLVWLGVLYGSHFVHLFTNAFHFGIVILSIINIGLWVKYCYSRNGKYIFSAILFNSFVGVLSDSLFIVQSVLPLAATVMISSLFLNKISIKKGAILSFFIVGSGLLGHFLYPLIVTHPIRPSINLGSNRARENFAVLFEMINNILTKNPVFSFVILMYLILSLRLLYVILIKGGGIKESVSNIIVALYSLLTIAASFSFNLLLQGGLPVADRYMLPVFVFPVIVVFFSAHSVLKEQTFKCCIYFCLFCIFLSIVSLLPKLKNGLNTEYYSADIACVDEALGHASVSNGIAQYWDAKFIQNWSKLDLTLAQYQYDLSESRWITSERYFRDQYDFAILSKNSSKPNKIPKDELVRINGEPKEIKKCGDITLYIYGKNKLRTARFKRSGDQYTWQACELPSGIGSCEKESGARNAQKKESGHLTYGPYEILPYGIYSFEIIYSSRNASAESVGTWDVGIALPEEVKIINNGSITGTDGRESVVRGEFELAEKYNRKKIEVRTFKNQSYHLKVYSVAITKIE